MNKNTPSLLLCACLVAPAIALAQEDASRLEKRFEQPVEPKSTLQPLLFPITEQVPPAEAGQLRFTLRALTVTGNTAFSDAALKPLYAGLLDREITLLDLYALRDAITAQYGNAGFGLSKAIIPPQRIEADGLVSITVIEGFVDVVLIAGGSADQRAYLDYAADRIKAERPLNARTLERYLLLANERFAIRVTSTLKPSESTPAASTLILRVEPASKIDGSASLDNRGTESAGPTQIYTRLALNGLAGRASQSAISYATTQQTSELRYVALSHTEVVSNEGSSLTLGWIDSHAQPGLANLRALDVDSHSTNWSLKLAHPFVRTRQRNLTGYVSYQQQDTQGHSLGATTSDDRLRSVRIGLNADRADAYEGINQALVEASFGLRGFGASSNDNPLKSRADGRSIYRKLTVNLSRQQELGMFSPALGRFSLQAALMGQLAGSGLLSSEECGVGGQQFGRAYDASELLGDSCIAASLELRYAANTAGGPFSYAQFYGFYDGGATANRVPLSTTDQRIKSLVSTGLGVRFGLPNNLSGSIDIAQPLTRTVANEGNRHTRLFASLSVRF